VKCHDIDVNQAGQVCDMTLYLDLPARQGTCPMIFFSDDVNDSP
jgi:hypothetical protein